MDVHLVSLLSLSSGVYAFVVLKQDADAQEMDLPLHLKDMVSKKIAKYASPDCIQVTVPSRETQSLKTNMYSSQFFFFGPDSCSLFSVCQKHAQVK